mgnify:CR=1 FL=1
MGLRDEWGPMGCGIWGRVALKWMGGWGGMNGFLWDVGFGVGWPKGGHMGHRDGWVPMGCGIWGRVVLKWTYGTGMGEYGAQG